MRITLFFLAFGALSSSQKQKHRGLKMREYTSKIVSNGNFLKGSVWYEFGDEMGRTILLFTEPCPNWVCVHAGLYPISEEGVQVSVLPVCRAPSAW